MVVDDSVRIHFSRQPCMREQVKGSNARRKENISHPPFLPLFLSSCPTSDVNDEFLGYIKMLPGFFSFSPFSFLLVLPLRFSSNLVFLQKIKTEGKKISFILRRSRGGYSSQYV